MVSSLPMTPDAYSGHWRLGRYLRLGEVPTIKQVSLYLVSYWTMLQNDNFDG